MLEITGLSKIFTLHQQGGAQIQSLHNLSLSLGEREAVAISGPSGRGKSSLLKVIYGSYLASSGVVRLKHGGTWVDVARAEPRKILDLRRTTIGYVTQFLRVIPRIPTLRIVAEPMLQRGASEGDASDRARRLLAQLNIPEKLWHLSPTTFSGGEQQRVNIARGFAASYPLLLLDEPTASLDGENRARVIQLIKEARKAGSAILGIFHDEADRGQVCDREVRL